MRSLCQRHVYPEEKSILIGRRGWLMTVQSVFVMRVRHHVHTTHVHNPTAPIHTRPKVLVVHSVQVLIFLIKKLLLKVHFLILLSHHYLCVYKLLKFFPCTILICSFICDLLLNFLVSLVLNDTAITCATCRVNWYTY